MTRQAAANETRPALSAVVILRSPRTVIIHALSGADVELVAGIAGRVTHGNRGSDCHDSPAFNRGVSRFWLDGRFLPDFGMAATGDLSQRRVHDFAIGIKPILLPVRCPTFLKSVRLLARGDTESSKRQDHGANTDVRLRAFAADT